MKNRRTSQRMDCRVQARVVITKSGEEMKAHTVNLSSGGVLLVTPQPLKAGTEVKLGFQVGHLNVPGVRGEVLRTSTAFAAHQPLAAVAFDRNHQALLDAARHDERMKQLEAEKLRDDIL